MRWNVTDIAAAVHGQIMAPNAQKLPELVGVATDSRADCHGQLFIALKGERFDAHDYLAQAITAGAAALLVERGHDLAPLALPVIEVEDTRLALGQLAATWRRRFDIPVLAVTGSNGKTTTREMIAAILRTAYHETAGEAVVLSPQGNFNNDIGLPLTLLKLAAKHRAAVVELGMNHPGEIAALTRLAAPTVALVTNAQRAHLEGLGDLEAVAREKGSIYAGLQADGVALVNDEDAYAGLWRAQNAGRRVIGFGLTAASDIFGVAQLHGLETRLTLHTPQGQADIALSAPGRHNVMNALAAAAAAFALGLPLQTIAAGLENFRGVKGRLQRLSGSNGADILDDTYNANPDSVRAGIAVLAATVGRKILVLGDMGEIGAGSLQYHDEIGGYAKSMGIDALYALGDASQQAARNFGAGGSSFSTPEALLKALQGEALHPGDTLLIKGSRFMKMERIVQALVSPSQEGEP